MSLPAVPRRAGAASREPATRCETRGRIPAGNESSLASVPPAPSPRRAPTGESSSTQSIRKAVSRIHIGRSEEPTCAKQTAAHPRKRTHLADQRGYSAALFRCDRYQAHKEHEGKRQTCAFPSAERSIALKIQEPVDLAHCTPLSAAPPDNRAIGAFGSATAGPTLLEISTLPAQPGHPWILNLRADPQAGPDRRRHDHRAARFVSGHEVLAFPATG